MPLVSQIARHRLGNDGGLCRGFFWVIANGERTIGVKKNTGGEDRRRYQGDDRRPGLLPIPRFGKNQWPRWRRVRLLLARDFDKHFRIGVTVPAGFSTSWSCGHVRHRSNLILWWSDHLRREMSMAIPRHDQERYSALLVLTAMRFNHDGLRGRRLLYIRWRLRCHRWQTLKGSPRALRGGAAYSRKGH
jgi:hypothetical protein